MIALDTNLLLRLIVQDDSRQTQQVRHLLQQRCGNGDVAFISLIVLCETVWTLRYTFDYRKPEIVRALQLIVNTRELQIEQEEVVLSALQNYVEGKADFADYLLAHVAAAHQASPLYTFDRKLAQHPLAELVA